MSVCCSVICSVLYGGFKINSERVMLADNLYPSNEHNVEYSSRNISTPLHNQRRKMPHPQMAESQASGRDQKSGKSNDSTPTDHQGCTPISSSSRYGDFLESKDAQVSKLKESPVGSPSVAKSHQNSLLGNFPSPSTNQAGTRSVTILLE